MFYYTSEKQVVQGWDFCDMILLRKKVKGGVSQMQISFQPIKPEDVEKIFQFQKELIECYEDLSSINCEKVFAWCKKKIQVTMQDYRRIMVGKELAGYFALHKEASGEWELDDLDLFPQFQNQGIGTQVVRDIIEQTAPQPLMLYVFTQNIGAVRLYERLGFVFSQKVGTTRMILRYHRT